MSRFRASPSKSPFRSPARLYETERDAIIEDEIRYKSAIRAESDGRRVNEELAMLQSKVRLTHDMEAKVQSLLRQNSQLARDNDELSRELSERRYELERIRSSAIDHADREAIKSGQLYETNKSLEIQIELLKKERLESNRLYEAHIDKLERMLDEKILELDSTTLRCNEFSKELELAVIRFQEEKNRLKNLMNRTEHQLERELEYTKEKTTTEKFSEIDSLKRNHAAQIVLLEDEISKLKNLNYAKTEEFQHQLVENRNLRKRHDQEVRALGAQNDELRGRMLKLEQINRSEVENIQVKYNDYHHQGTSSMKEQHGRQIKLLLDEIDKLKWLTQEKNSEIQNLVQDKRELRRVMDENQLELGSEIDSLKNKLYTQQEKNAEDSHNLMARINDLCDKSLRESEGYHERAKQFMKKISNLEAEVGEKQNSIDKNKRSAQIQQKQLQNKITQANSHIEKLKRDLQDSQQQKESVEKRFKEHKEKSEKQISRISQELSETETRLEETQGKLDRKVEESSGNDDLLKTEIQSLRKTVTILEEKLSQEQSRHSSEMSELSSNINEKIKRLQAAQKKTLQDHEKSTAEQIGALSLRVEKSNRDKDFAEDELKKYIEMYNDLEKYFKDPHEGALFEEKSKDSIYSVLQKVTKSTIHIF